MSLSVDGQGNITLYQGDTGYLVVNGLNEETNQYVFLAIQDKNRNFIGDELKVTSNNKPTVSFYLDSDLTNMLTVPRGSAYETYYYGVKTTNVGDTNEDTLLIAGKDYGEMNIITVFPKIVEGIANV